MNKHSLFISLPLIFLTLLPCNIESNANQLYKSGLAQFFLKHLYNRQQKIKPKVAVIYLTEPTNYGAITNHLFEVAKNKEILGVLLIIDNFGGDMGLFSLLHDTIKKITTIKPVVSLVAGSALSGGYLVASATDYIIAHSCSEIGSIGVVRSIFKFENPKKMGAVEASLAVEYFHAGALKGIGDPYSAKLSLQEKEYVQEHLNKAYALFVKLVAQNRKLDIEKYTEWAEGKSFLSPEALQLGLIDEIGTFFEAESKMLELANKRNQTDIFVNEIDFTFYDNSETKTATDRL